MSDTLIKVEGVSKKFCRSLKKSLWYGLQDLGNEIRGRRHGGNGDLRPEEFWAVNDVSFKLKRGECLGLIGKNGAGKTTLLRILNGLIKPDAGRVEMHGRLGALIALGAGFNPILTGRENIFINASVLGLTKREINEKLDEIIDFAEIAEFIDTPVQSYSSGMQVRLGFAVATSFSPDILILDEVLAVGDAGFRNKCYNRLGSLMQNSAVIVVSHSMHDISRISTAGLFIKKGVSTYYTEIQQAISAYEEGFVEDFLNGFEKTDGNYVTRVSAPKIIDVDYGESFSLELDIECRTSIKGVLVRLIIYGCDGAVLAEWNNSGDRLTIPAGECRLIINMKNLNFVSGVYPLGINLNDKGGLTMLYWNYKATCMKIENGPVSGPAIFPNGTAKIHVG
jgi:lipopolysaccharide transport system ATP-binding protein